MKKLFYIYVTAIALITFSGCKKLLDIKPVNAMMPVSVKDYESILVGGYPRVDYFFNTELMTDNAYVNLNTGTDPKKAQEPWFVWASSMLPDGISQDPYWGQLYKSIYYANTILDNFSTRTPAAEDKKLYEIVKGEALALRAYCYFYLINLYAQPYSPEHLKADGVPMPLTAENVNETAKNNVREPVEKVWKQIANDIDEASKLLVGKTSINKFRFNYISLQLLKARTALFMQEYQTAIDAATVVMNSSSLTDLNGIQPIIDSKGNRAFTYDFGFIDTDYNKEVLFFTGGKANTNLFYYSRAEFKPTVELLNLTKRYGYLTDYRQYLFESFVEPNTSEAVTDGPTYYRMFATQQREWFFIGLKASEAYVIRAEAYARTNKNDLAIADLNDVLVKRIKRANYVPLKISDFASNELLLNRVLEERRVETAFDAGLRWFDLRRLGKPEIQHAYKNGVIYTLKKNDPRYVLQIPPSEINNSPNMPLNPR